MVHSEYNFSSIGVGKFFSSTTKIEFLFFYSDLVTRNTGVMKMNFYSARNACIYRTEIDSLLFREMRSPKGKSISQWRPLFLIIPLRLGIDSLNSVYFETIKELFHLPTFTGILGGKPKAAVYITACQENLLYYLDPHTVQTSVKDMRDKFSHQVSEVVFKKKKNVSKT